MHEPVELKELKEKILQYNPKSEWERIIEAYLFAKDAHEGQKRHSGEPYIIHPLAVAEILTEVEADDKTIIAGLLHDVIEDTEYTFEDVEQRFGHDVAVLTEGVTKLGKVKGRTKSEQKMENIRKMILAMATDIRVIIVKLADRLHNMRTLQFHSSEVKRRQIAQETLDIYSPLANRLGVFQFKWELEDLCLQTLEPEKYRTIVEQLASTRDSRLAYIQDFIDKLKTKLDESKIQYVDIYGRSKNLYSIYRKMLTQNKELPQIYDVLAVRVIVKDVTECYSVLGIVHTLCVPVPGRFKDYIAMPKQNMYQSIHTTIIGPNGKPLEVQIRTEEMHHVAEHGIAAHWQYKEGKSAGTKPDQKLAWLRQMLDWQKEVKDADEFMASMKYDLEDELVYVFTPKGDIYELPYGSIPLDFAYRVHTEVGHKAIGARCNGKIVTFDYVLQNGDIMEIITSKMGKPSRDWLKLVKTPQARNKIRAWFRKEQRDENVIKGKEIFEREVRSYGDIMAPYLKGEALNNLVRRYNYASLENFYLAIGENHLTINTVINGIKDEVRYEEPKSAPEIKPYVEKKGHHGIVVKGADNVMIKFGHCCNPLPGDQVVGFITRGSGITVHRRDCINVCNGDPHRFIEVEWEDVYNTNFQAEIEVISVDRDRLTTDVMSAIADTKTVINTVFGRSMKDGTAILNLKMEVKSNSHFEYICNKIRRIKGVMEVKRVIHGKH
ncbi:MAG: bifunctional (p)ppGpp synthetase/guanosine-3',5'-bis(diphosphate) 3'-pyrophosphohydrolase [Firmicutes bacterium]|nr:bifunctional (p)ppGpp synthetase/guanosine-3',5'-bis(diphosphate) 3'-pyrophosphohydrolase [Bacillota bacterium]